MMLVYMFERDKREQRLRSESSRDMTDDETRKVYFPTLIQDERWATGKDNNNLNNSPH